VIQAAQRGDRPALESLLRSEHARIHALCRRLTGNDADAADATQEALIAIVRGLPRFDGRSRFTTWSYRVATNACLDELRRRSRRPIPTLPVETDTGPSSTSASGPSGAHDPEVVVANRLDVDAALATLPEEFRVAVVLRDLCDLDYAEIAEALDIPAGTVRSRIARGRAALALRLGGNPPTPPERPSNRP
jgi:RNA polymerase sigma-70 factor (ECF subfamily)